MRFHVLNQVLSVSLFALAALGACAHSERTQPQDMGVAQHEAAANQEEQRTVLTDGERANVSWSDADAASVARHRDLAAQHRAAAQALRDAEAQACTGLANEDRDASPFSHHADIRSVNPLRESSGGLVSRDAGARIVFRAVPGLTAEWLQRIVNCHLARNASADYQMPEMADCPLVPRGVSAKVRSIGDGFAVDITSTDDATAAEIWRRARMIHVKR